VPQAVLSKCKQDLKDAPERSNRSTVSARNSNRQPNRRKIEVAPFWVAVRFVKLVPLDEKGLGKPPHTQVAIGAATLSSISVRSYSTRRSDPSTMFYSAPHTAIEVVEKSSLSACCSLRKLRSSSTGAGWYHLVEVRTLPLRR
jgi:hypothetical protein